MKRLWQVLGLLALCGLAYMVFNGRIAQDPDSVIVVTREDGSGTRSAFVELVGVVDSNEDDFITPSATVQNSENAVMSTVASVANGIGYASVSSVNDSVKAVAIDGAQPTIEALQAGDYRIAREFNIAWDAANQDEVLADFVSFICSKEGDQVIVDAGYVPQKRETDASYKPKGVKGSLTVVGSTSVTPVMERLDEAYRRLNPEVEINITSNGSTAGMTAAMNGSGDLGMASRPLTQQELGVLAHEVIALDGLAVIVNKENPRDNLTLEDVRQIFLGEVNNWSLIK